jgi:hypothetical protein
MFRAVHRSPETRAKQGFWLFFAQRSPRRGLEVQHWFRGVVVGTIERGHGAKQISLGKAEDKK